MSTPTACSSGEYQNQTGQTSCHTCPAGHMCPLTTVQPFPCPLGYFAAASQTSCTVCPSGSFCPQNASASTACADGTFSLEGASTCTVCPTGFKCNSKTAVPTVCGDTEFNAIQGQQSCTSCPAGQECLDRTLVPTSCAFGEYSIAGSGICTTCSQNGKECPDIKTANTRSCPANSYYDWWGSTPPMCKACQPGNICTDTTFIKIPCPKGHYKNSNVCTPCSAGKFCPNYDGSEVDCPTGYYQDQTGATSCKQVPPGKTSTDQINLTNCDPGQYYSGLGQCTDCQVGFKCPSPQFRMIPCLPGEYQHQIKKTTCIECPAGSFCASTSAAPTAVANDGLYFAPARSISQIKCPVGWKCTNQAVQSPLCQWGNYPQSNGVCTPCPVGNYCLMILGDTPKTCPGGTYSPAGTMQCIPCPPGKTCDQATDVMTSCLKGQYTFETEQTCTWGRTLYFTPLTISSARAPCPPGSYQDATGRHTCRPCPANKKCTQYSNGPTLQAPNTVPQTCPNGQFSLAGDGFCLPNPAGSGHLASVFQICAPGQYTSANLQQCSDCTKGHFCPDPSLMPQICPPGTYQDQTGQYSCKVCPAGKYCLYGAQSITDCPAGSECPVSWLPPKKCTSGYYSDANAQKCSKCTDKKKCQGSGITSVTMVDCPANMYCNTPFDGALPQYRLCPAGTKSSAGQAAFASDCTKCTAGTYCQFTLSRTEVTCPAGYYCLLGTEFATQYPCPEGEYNSSTGQTSDAACLQCSVGKYCRAGSIVNTHPCPYGAKCSAGANNETSQIWCPQGFYSDQKDGETTCKACIAGHYCPKGQMKAFPCPAGTYRTGVQGKDINDCTPCDAGYACRIPGSTTAQQQPCANGHYCPIGTQSPYQFPCPYGTYSNSAINLTSISGCIVCPKTYACPLGTHTVNDAYQCPQGHYCPDGTQSPYSHKCPAGTYNTLRGKQQLSDCVDCPIGYFCPAGSISPTDLCPPGHYCELKTKYQYQFPCTGGKYQPKWGQSSSLACIQCPAGYYCEQGTDYPVACPRGHHCPAGTELRQVAQTTVGSPVFNTRTGGQVVAAGKYAQRRSGTQTACPQGMYSNSGADLCLTCPSGFDCPTNDSAQDKVIQTHKCAAGDFCYQGSGDTPAKCPIGNYCEAGVFLPKWCKAGTYAKVVGKNARGNCDNTSQGYWTPPGSAYDVRYPCQPGHYCEAGSIQPDQKRCPAGTYRDTVGATASGDCVTCTKGHYCPLGTYQPIPCGDGHYCDVTGLSQPIDCAPGTYSPDDKRQVACEQCPIGKACTNYGLSKPDFQCAPGFLCTAGSSQTSNVSQECTAGGYCELGTVEKESCKAGTFNPSTGKEFLLDCEDCTPGKYCDGSNSAAETGDCDAGYYCTGGATTPTQEVALPGYFTLAGAIAQTECAATKYQDLFAQSTCKNCEAGFYCDTKANDGTARNVCQSGYYCPESSQSPIKCPVGTFSYEKGLKAESECLPCLPGRYCASQATNQPSEMSLCSAGYFCKEKAIIGTPENGTGADVGKYGTCTAGHYCPVGTADPIPCPAGRFAAVGGLKAETDCTLCTAGKYCEIQGLTTPTGDCEAGYYCPTGSKSQRQNPCPAGSRCPAGSSAHINCLAGTYQKNTRQADCLQCPDGYDCSSNQVTPQKCPKGNYCQGGNVIKCAEKLVNPAEYASTSANCAPCPPGKICNSQGLQQATLNCPAGFYCSPVGDKTAGDKTGQCAAGTYCPQQSAVAIKCPGGYYCTGGATITKCSKGYFCTGSATKTNPTSAGEGGGECPPGYYCPQGSDSPVACPPGTYNPSKLSTQLADCLPCPAGKYCKNAAATSFTGDCSSGYYCPNQNRSVPNPVARICSANNKCDGSASEISCLTNSQYQPNKGQSTCLTCPTGFLCSSSGFTNCNDNSLKYCDSNYSVQTCVSGSYTPSVNAASISECVQISAGYRFSTSGSTISYTQCTQGNYCQQGSATATTCPQGSYCPTGSAIPIKCKAGYYCSGTGNQAPDDQCDAGYYCIEGAITATPTDGTTGNQCPKGHYCLKGSSSPTACPIGTYRSSTGGTLQSDCTACDLGRYCDALGLESPKILCYQGYFCDANSTSPNPRQHSCTPGHKCPVGSSAQTNCGIGEYQPLPLQGNCLACPERYYCATQGLAQATICPKGKYCPEGTGATPTDCLAGTYNDRFGLKSQNECQQCPTGYACVTSGMTAIADSDKCTAGYYCVGGSTTKTQYSCPQGYYCPAGTYNPLPCPIGTYSDSTQLTQASACTDCPIGYYCSLKAASKNQVQSDTYKCAAGYLCSGGSTTPTPISTGGKQCDAGKYCQRGATTETNCPKGTYNPYVGQASCTTCPAGRLCASEGLQTFADCPVGKYCLAGAQDATDCPAGTYNPRINLSSASECLQCDPGKYCSGGSDSTSGDCDAGNSCPRGSSVKNPTAAFSFSPLTNGVCPTGHYCLQGNKLPVQCPLGTYSGATGLSTQTGPTGCTACPAGFYCDQLGLVAATKKCAAGFICLAGSQHPRPTDGTKGKPCSKGKYCPEGTTTQLDCVGGTYEPRQGSSSCQQCPAGYKCAVGAIKPLICPISQFCEAGKENGVKCPNGTFGKNTGLQSSSQCTPCVTGKYCQNGVEVGDCQAGFFCHSGADSPNPSTMQCPSGHYCLAGATAPTACPNNKVRQNPGATQQADCVNCTLGFYCLQGDPNPHKCPKGHYCDGLNSSSPVDPKQCPLNTYNPDQQKQSINDCLDCPAGTICSDKAIASLDLYYCPKGKYCLKFTDKNTIPTAQDCPGGTYNPSRGKGALTDCIDCPAGSYCTGATIYPKKCDSGTYCLAKSTTSTPCPVGYYCPYGSPDKIQCPAGYYCQAVGTDIYTKCPSGTYCPAGSTTPTKCPIGTYGARNPQNISEAAECVSCQQGTYQDVLGQTTCKPCTAGYTCLGGTIIANPTIQATHKGKICPKGFYCPQGSWQPKACPQGTYQPSQAKTSASDCLSCPINFFTNQDGQSQCKACGGNAFNLVTGFNTCSCKGKNRDFQPQKSHCMCSIGFETVGGDSLDNSSGDCQPKVYQLCTGGQVYNDRRQCVSQNDCSSQCGTIGGSVIYNVGLCQCSVVSDPDTVCNSACRAGKTKYTLDLEGNLVATYSNGQTAKVSTTNLKSNSGLVGATQCATQSCRVVSVGFGSGSFTGNYDMNSAISNYMGSQPRTLEQYDENTMTFSFSNNRSLQSQTQITNPIICIKEKETLVFQVNVDSSGSGQHEYPVYDRDSLINTNTSFDYSAFTQLQAQILAGNPVQSFAFTFQNAGTYVFYNSIDPTKKLVVSIKTQAVSCPSEDAYIMPTTYQNLLSVGASLKQDLVYDPNWGLILGILAAIVFLIVILILIITYYKRKQWKLRVPSTIPYRLAHQREQFQEISANTHTLFRNRRVDEDDDEDDDHTSGLSSGASEEEERKAEEERKKKRGERYAIQQNKIDEMLNKADVLSMEFLGSDDRDEDMQKIIQMRLKELLDKLRRIREGDDDQDEFNKGGDDKNFNQRDGNKNKPGSEFGKQSNEQNDPRQEARLKEEQRIQKEQERQVNKMDSDKQAFMEEHLRDGDQRQRKFLDLIGRMDLTDQERDNLLRDFNNNADRVNGLLEEEERKQQEDLKRKLEERRQRRLKLRAKIQDLENEKDSKSKDLRQALQDLNDETAAKMRAVNEELQAEENEVLNAAQKRMDKQRQDKRLEFQALLGKNKKSDDMEMLVNDYEEDSHALERKLQIEFDSQKKNLKQMLEERRERKRLQFENQRRQKERNLLQHRDEQVKDIENEIEKLKRVAENESLNEKIENLVDAKMRQEDVMLDKIKDENQKELEELEKKHQAQLDKVETETVQTDQQDEQDRQRQLIQLDQEEEQLAAERKKRDDIKRQLDECDNELLKAQLMKQLQEQQNALMMRLKKEQSQQKADLDSKLAQRRLKKLQRKKDIQASQDKQKRMLLEKQMKDEEKVKKDLGDKDLMQILHDIKMNIEVDARPYAIQKAIDEKHARELSELLMRQFKEKAQELQDHMMRLMEQKTAQIKILKDMYDGKRKHLEQQRESMDENEFEKRMQDLKLEESEKKDDIQDRYLELQANKQNEITRNLLEKHTRELMNLKLKQNEETKHIIENYIPQGMAREIFSENLDELNQEFEKFKRELDERREKQLNQLEERERILRQQREQYKEKMNKMDQFGNFLGQHQMFAGQRQKAKRFDMGAGKIEEEQKRLIAGYKQMNEEVEKVLNQEQQRQKELFEEKVRQKKAAREQFRQKRKQELEDAKLKQEQQDKKQKEVEEMKKDSQFEKILVKYEIGSKIYDKVKGAYKLQDEHKKNKLANFKDLKKKIGGVDTDPTLRTQTPAPNMLKIPGTSDHFGDNLLGASQSISQTKQAITTDDEILAKLMLKINNIENRLTKFKVSGNKN